MRIETQRLIVRDLQVSDAESFASMAKDGSLTDIGFDKDAESWIQDWIKEAVALLSADDPRKDYLAYAIERKEDGAVIGSVGCSCYRDLQKVGATYFIGAKYRGSGYAAEALRAYVPVFFARYGVFELIATIREENIPSWKTIEHAGFILAEKRLYRDSGDPAAQLYRFYVCRRS